MPEQGQGEAPSHHFPQTQHVCSVAAALAPKGVVTADKCITSARPPPFPMKNHLWLQLHLL